MSDHVLKVIRDAAKTALTGQSLGSSTITALVNRAEDQALQDAELPAYRISVGPEDVQISSMGVTRVYERTVDLQVDCCQKKNSTFEDDALELQRIAEVQIASGLTGAKSADLVHSERIEDAKGEKPVIVNRLTFRILYYTANGSPQTAL